jgi:FMN phosphatase YigB (HAD superfamily)
MKVILFDLGNTLERQGNLNIGAMETLQTIQSLQDMEGQAPVLALISDFLMPDRPAQIPILQQQYYDILEQLGIRQFFEPLSKRVTLSTEVGVNKPNKKIFQTALQKIDHALSFQDAIFITEDLPHITKARDFGMRAIHFKSLAQTAGDVNRLTDLIPLIKDFLHNTL